MTSWAAEHIEMLKRGATVTFRPRGRSMVMVEPMFYGNGVEVGDVVLCRVGRVDYLHLVKRHDKKQHRFQIGNNRGRINGWIEPEMIFGRIVR
jgi:hypothetical protein